MKPQTPLEEDWLLPNVFVRRMACKTHVGHTDCYSYFLWLSNGASAEANTPHGSFFLCLYLTPTPTTMEVSLAFGFSYG